jgi:AcrR family transcriptional regulator
MARVTGPQQLVEAAIASILEVGFYRSSTNEIARRADVSWGAVQYHFGTREALLLAAVKELDHRFNTALEAGTVSGKTLEDRLTSLYRILGPLYDDPLFLVRLQILLNLQHDPDTSGAVMDELAAQAAVGEVSVRRLLTETLGRVPDPVTVQTLYHSIRGYALSQQLATALPAKGTRPTGPSSVRRFLRNLAVAEEARSSVR